MVEKFRGDEHLSDVYANYLKRMEANSYLYLNLLSDDGKLVKTTARICEQPLQRTSR